MIRLAALVALAACKGGEGDGDGPGPVDIRIDGAGDAAVDSVGTRMCAEGDAVIAAWIDDRDGATAVWVNRSADGGATWAGPEIVSRDEGDDSHAFAVDLHCQGDAAWLVWEDDRDGILENHNIYVSRSTDAGADWSEPIALDDDPEGDHTSLGPQLAAAGDDVYVAWFDARNGAYDIYVATSHDGGESFGPPVRADSDEAGEAYSAWPQIAAGEGLVYVVWEDSRDGLSDVRFTTSFTGGATFEDDIRLDGGDDPGEHDSFSPRIAAEGPVAYVVWHDERDGALDVLMNYTLDSGVSFADDAIRVDGDEEPGAFDSLYPQLLVRAGEDDQGEAHIVWEDARHDGMDVFYRRADGGELGQERRLDTDDPGFGNSLFPQIAAAGRNIAVGWQDRRADTGNVGYGDIYYNFSADGGATWTGDDLRVDRVEPGTKSVDDLSIAVVGDRILSAWTDGRRGTSDVFFHAHRLGEESPAVRPDGTTEE